MLDDYASLQLRFWFHDNINKVLSPQERRLSQRLLYSLWSGLSLIAAISSRPIITLLLVYVVTSPRQTDSRIWKEQRLTFAQSISLLRWEGHCIVAILASWVLLVHHLLPGQRYEGPPCGNGIRPVYHRNGFMFFVLSTAIVAAVSSVAGPVIYKILPALASSIFTFSMVASIAVYIKARVDPSTSESAPFTNNIVYDLYNGIELYPRIGELHLKQTLIRTGAVVDLLVLLTGLTANLHRVSPNVSTGVSLALFGVVYLHRARRFWHEECYSHAFEVTSYNVGFNEFLRYLLLRPFLLNLGSLSAVSRTTLYPPLSRSDHAYIACCCFIAASTVVLTYLVDRQKFLVKYKRGKCQTWGRMAETISAFYVDRNDLRRSSTLLCSGYWGLARHLNYTFEMLTHGMLALPGLLLYRDHFCVVPFLYIVTVLIYRTWADFEKCRNKYGPYWTMYCQRVPFTLIPGLV